MGSEGEGRHLVSAKPTNGAIKTITFPQFATKLTHSPQKRELMIDAHLRSTKKEGSKQTTSSSSSSSRFLGLPESAIAAAKANAQQRRRSGCEPRRENAQISARVRENAQQRRRIGGRIRELLKKSLRAPGCESCCGRSNPCFITLHIWAVSWTKIIWALLHKRPSPRGTF
jgi:hypothetical protein